MNLPDQPEPITLEDVLVNIKDPRRWIDPDTLIQLMIVNPSLRGFAYGYVSEHEFTRFLNRSCAVVTEHFKDDDHRRTKADRTLVCNGRRFTVQLKSLQTNSIRLEEEGRFLAKVQNDASDRRKVVLPNGHELETTCYVVGEYDIPGVSLQPFLGRWEFAFKKNKELRRTTSRKYAVEDRQYLLATLEDISFPLDSSWTTDLLSLLADPDLGEAHVVDQTSTTETVVVEVPESHQEVVVRKKRRKSKGQ